MLSYPRNSRHFAPSEFHLFGPLKESLEVPKFNDIQDVQQHAFWTASASVTEISMPRASWRLVKRWEHCVNLPRDILLKSGKKSFPAGNRSLFKRNSPGTYWTTLVEMVHVITLCLVSVSIKKPLETWNLRNVVSKRTYIAVAICDRSSSGCLWCGRKMPLYTFASDHQFSA